MTTITRMTTTNKGQFLNNKTVTTIKTITITLVITITTITTITTMTVTITVAGQQNSKQIDGSSLRKGAEEQQSKQQINNQTNTIKKQHKGTTHIIKHNPQASKQTIDRRFAENAGKVGMSQPELANRACQPKN